MNDSMKEDTPKPVKWAPVYVCHFRWHRTIQRCFDQGEPVKGATCLCGLALAPHGNQVEPVYVGHRIDLEHFSILHYLFTTMSPKTPGKRYKPSPSPQKSSKQNELKLAEKLQVIKA